MSGGVASAVSATRHRPRARLFGDLGQDVRYVLRSLARTPAFAATAVLVIALGVGAGTGIFSAVNAVLLRPLPFADPDRLVMLWERNPEKDWFQVSAAPANALDWRERVDALEDVAMYDEFTDGINFVGESGAEQLRYTSVSGNFFDVLGVRPAVGRGFTWEDTWDTPHARVVLSWDTWVSRFGADPSIVGKSVDFAGSQVDVVGVMPEAFAFPDADVRLWRAFDWNPADRTDVFFRRAHFVRAIGRLADGATVEQASAQLGSVAFELEREYPETNKLMGAGLTPLHEFLVGDRSQALWMLLSAVGLLLLIACSNVGNLMLVRAQSRERELAVRRALGAAGGRLVRLVVIEAAMLASVGGTLGFLGGVWGVRALDGMRSLTLPGFPGLEVDARVIAFATALLALSAFLFGVVPALRARGADPGAALSESGRTGQGRRKSLVAQQLVVAQLALSLVLFAAAGLLGRSFLRLSAVDPGMRVDNVLTFEVGASSRRYPEYVDVRGFFERIEERLEALPEVEDAAYIRIVSLTTPSWSSDFTVSIEDPAAAASGGGARGEVSGSTGAYAQGGQVTGHEILHREVSPDYFDVVGGGIVAGRGFTSADGVDTDPVVVVNEAFVKKYFPGKDLLGLRITNDRPATDKSFWRTIVGVVGDEHQSGLSTPARPEVFAPFYQAWDRATTAVLRTRGRPEDALPAVKAALAEIDPLVPIVRPRSMQSIVNEALARDRFLLTLVGVFGVAALLLACVGVYGVMAETTRRRTREIAVRLALGARPRDVRRMLVGQGMILVAVGLGLGVVGAFGGSGLLEALLYETEPTDPVALGGTLALLATVALVACWLPARRATRVDPVVTLKGE